MPDEQAKDTVVTLEAYSAENLRRFSQEMSTRALKYMDKQSDSAFLIVTVSSALRDLAAGLALDLEAMARD